MVSKATYLKCVFTTIFPYCIPELRVLHSEINVSMWKLNLLSKQGLYVFWKYSAKVISSVATIVGECKHFLCKIKLVFLQGSSLLMAVWYGAVLLNKKYSSRPASFSYIMYCEILFLQIWKNLEFAEKSRKKGKVRK